MAALYKMFSCQGGLIWLDMNMEHSLTLTPKLNSVLSFF